MILSDGEIRAELAASERLAVTPLAEDAIQPCSIDVRLCRWLMMYRGADRGRLLDPCDVDSVLAMDRTAIDAVRGYVLAPGAFVLGATLEWVAIPDDIVCRVEGRSTLGRAGLMVHVTAGLVDPGFCGQITLEILNVNPRPLLLRAEMPIAQLTFERMTHSAQVPYGRPGRGSRYQDQRGPTGPRPIPARKT